MPYYPRGTEKYTYFCPNCLVRYKWAALFSACGVLHVPGVCCHKGEVRVEEVSSVGEKVTCDN